MSQLQNPQAEQMGHESMVRTLAAQAEAVWPQERALFGRYGLAGPVSILDVGCGTGEATARLAARYPRARILGIDLDENHLARSRARCAPFGERVRFQVGDARMLDLRDDLFDLTLCRHLLQVVPRPERAIDEMVRVTRPGGWLHILAEDYAMVQSYPARYDQDTFWLQGPIAFGEAVGTDLRVGRKVYAMLAAHGLEELAVDYVVVDTVRVARAVLAAMMEAWRDGFADVIAARSSLTPQRVHAHFDDLLACIRNPMGYFVWQVPVLSGQVPGV